MKRITLFVGMMVLAAALVCLPAPAKAAMWVGMEIGPNWKADSDVKASGDGVSLSANYKWETKVLGGAIFGYHFINSGFLAYNWPDWMKYFQFAIDFSYTTIEAGPKSGSIPDLVDLRVSRIKGDVFTVAFLFIGCYGFYPDSVSPFGRVFGYFSDVYEYPQTIFQDSNQKEMIFINVGGTRLDTEAFAGEVAHEYQHLIHWNQDRNEDLWINEAMASLVSPEGVKVGGLSNEVLFSENPNIQLTARPERAFSTQDDSHYAHYAAERLFSIYLLEQFGADFIRAVVGNPAPGVFSIQEELNKLEGAPKFDDVYATWLLANFLDMPDLRQGQFGYANTDPISPVPQIIQSYREEPVNDKLPPYGARYYLS